MNLAESYYYYQCSHIQSCFFSTANVLRKFFLARHLTITISCYFSVEMLMGAHGQKKVDHPPGLEQNFDEKKLFLCSESNSLTL